MLPLISVIIPVYNAQGYIAKTLQKLCDQSYPNIEFIAVNDGSADNSGRIIAECSEKDSRIILKNTENRGVSAARNAGIRAASGEYLMFCDADDYPEPIMAERLYSAAAGADITLCGFNKISAVKTVCDEFPEEKIYTSTADIKENLIMPMCVWGYSNNGCVPKSVYGSVCRGLYKKRFLCENNISFPVGVVLGEDMLFNIQAFFAAKEIRVIKDCLYNYVENPASATHTDSIKLWEKYKTLHYHAHILLEKLGFSENDIRWHDWQLSRYAVSAIIEGVCPLEISKKEKSGRAEKILRDEKLKAALKNLPQGLQEKDKLNAKALLLPASVVLSYYNFISKK